MKPTKPSKSREPYPEPKEAIAKLREVPPSYYAAAEVENVPAPESLVRTQI